MGMFISAPGCGQPDRDEGDAVLAGSSFARPGTSRPVNDALRAALCDDACNQVRIHEPVPPSVGPYQGLVMHQGCVEALPEAGPGVSAPHAACDALGIV